MRKPLSLSFAGALAGAALIAATGIAAPKQPKLDQVWIHPDFSSYRIERIAILPAATYDSNLDAAKMVEQAFGQAFRETGYRWTSAASARTLLFARSGGNDSLIKAIQRGVLEHERVDSLAAPDLSRWLYSDAVLSLRVDQWERRQLEWNEAGRPSTAVHVHAALVDSSGRLLWNISGSQHAEGAYNDPSAGVSGVKSSGLGTQRITAAAGAPTFPEVLAPLFTRWVERFPEKPAAADSTR